MKKTIGIVQILLYLISPFIALELAKTTTAVDTLFLAMFVIIAISEWLAIYHLGKVFDEQ